MATLSAEFRCYAELNDFLPPQRRQVAFRHAFAGHQSVKDLIESFGIPHPEVELILVNGVSVDFSHRPRDGDRVAVYPVFEALDVTSAIRLRERPLRVPRFVLDVHLARLARRLRLLGFDVLHRPDFTDPELIEVSLRDRRTLLTRDRALLKHKVITHGYFVRATERGAQAEEVLHRFDLRGSIAPFTRCLLCNGLLHPVAKETVLASLPERVRFEQNAFSRCEDCAKVYWPGSHRRRMAQWLDQLGEGESDGMVHP